MKKMCALVALVSLLALSCAQKSGEKIEFETVDMDGNEVTSELFSRNKVTMLNIWGTFCPPCIREMPDLGEIGRAYKDKGFEIVGVPIDVADRFGNVIARTKEDGSVIIEKTGADYTHAIPSRGMMEGMLEAIQVVPTTLFVDSHGNQIGEPYVGARSRADWEKIIDELLAKAQ